MSDKILIPLDEVIEIVEQCYENGYYLNQRGAISKMGMSEYVEVLKEKYKETPYKYKGYADYKAINDVAYPKQSFEAFLAARELKDE
jgi:hypothetical protein